MSNLRAVLKQLHRQRNQIVNNLSRVDKAIAAISSLNGRTRPKSGTWQVSARGRARMAAAQRARWAKWRKAKKVA